MCRKPLMAALIVALAGAWCAGAAVASPLPPQPGNEFLAAPLSAGQAVATPNSAQASYGRFFLFPNPINAPQEESVTAIDGQGGIHIVYAAETSNGGRRPAYYAACRAGCQTSTNWTVTPVGDLGLFGEAATLALDSQGRPRMMWFKQTTWDGNGTFHYAECNANCSSEASWTISGAIASNFMAPSDVHYFALDPQGRPRFVYLGQEPDYVTCDANCTNAASWHRYLTDAPGVSLYGLQLAFTPQGQPRLLSMVSVSNVDTLVYSWCNKSACLVPDDWSGVALFPLGYGRAYSLRLDALGRPRIALYQGAIDGQPAAEQLFYVWNNGAPEVTANWQGEAVGLPASYGKFVGLALDGADRPHLAFHIEDIDQSIYGLGYARCTAGCESASPTWDLQIVDTTEQIQQSWPIPLDAARGCTYSAWMEAGYLPSIAVDAAGNPAMAHWAKHMQSAPSQYSSCYLWKDVTGIRTAIGNVTAPTPAAPASVSLTGPLFSSFGVANTFTASANPAAVTLPLTYEWLATGQTTVTHTGQGRSDTVTFTWANGEGEKTVTVRVRNSVGGPVTASRTLRITAQPIVFDETVYLPLTRK